MRGGGAAALSSPAAAVHMALPVSVHASATPTHGYTRARGDVLRVDDEPRVHGLIAARRLAKRERDFKKADALREELRRECGVEVFDKTMIWKVIGSQGHVPLPSDWTVRAPSPQRGGERELPGAPRSFGSATGTPQDAPRKPHAGRQEHP